MNKKSAAAFVIAAGVLWGIISIFVKKLSAFGLSGNEISFLRVVTCSVLLFLFLLIYDRRLLRFRLRDIWMFIGTGIISLTLFSCCYFTTIIHVGASVAVSLLYTSPVFVMLFSALLFKEKITPKKIAAIVITVLGCALVSGIIGSDVRLGLSSLLTGIGSGLFYALYSIFGRYASEKYHPFTITFYTFLFASVGFLFLVNPAAVFQTLTESAGSFFIVIISGVLCGILPYVFYTIGLKYLETTAAGVLVAIEPLVGSLVGIIGFQETSEWGKILGIALVLASIVLLSVGNDTSSAS